MSPPAGRPLIIWDLDGTLVDSRADLVAAGNAARGAIGLPALPPAEVVSFVGDGAQKLIERLTPGCGEDRRALAHDAFLAAYDRGCCEATAAYAGIIEMMDRFAAADWAQAVATNKPARFAIRILAHARLDRHLAAMRAGTRKKPEPWMVHSLIDELHADPQRTWMAGDHRADLDAAAAAGVRGAFCAWGFGDRAGRHADAVAAHPVGLADLLLA